MRKLLIAVALMSITAPLYAANLAVSNAWVRLLPGDLPLAGYAHVVNDSAHEVTLVSVSSPDFATVQFHQSVDHAGMEEMVQLEQIRIAAGKTLDFAPGGYHLMLMDRKHPLAAGQHVALTLHFADGSRQTVQFVVRGATGK
ncbi:MAG TPA: copper chaperone PCu(A)C [Gammaproteobacteria bacterium]|nr:copper chaperone PCu(A)C [Gammaproteobacteria bacterium]